MPDVAHQRYLAIIPARGGSKGVPRKNIRLLAGRPLIEYTIEAARGVPAIDRCVVSTDDDEVARIAEAAGAEIIMRPSNLARDDTPTLPVLQHVVRSLAERESYTCDAVITLQPTSPLRTPRHIAEAIAHFESDPEADSLVSCIEVPHQFRPNSVMKLDDGGYLHPYLDVPLALRRQDKEPVFARNGAAVYITRTSCLSSFVFGGRLLPYMMSPEDSIDIDSEADLLAAEQALRARR
jgi:CMP-N-acetylneuraminic acid synthetase